MVGTVSLLSAATQEQVSDSLVADHRCCEPGFPQQAQPYRSREKAMGLAFVHNPDDPLFVTEQDSEVNQDRCVARIRICRPLYVT